MCLNAHKWSRHDTPTLKIIKFSYTFIELLIILNNNRRYVTSLWTLYSTEELALFIKYEKAIEGMTQEIIRIDMIKNNMERRQYFFWIHLILYFRLIIFYIIN